MKDNIILTIFKTLKKLLKFAFLYIGDYIFTIKLNKQHSSGLLIVRLDAIGDFIIWLDSAKELRRLYHKKKITLLANESWAGLALHFEYWDEVIPVSLDGVIKKPRYRWALFRKLRQTDYDVVVQTQFSRTFLISDSIVRATGARERIGSVGDIANIKQYQKCWSDRWYTLLLPASSSSLMEIERNAEFIAALSGKAYSARLSSIPALLDLPESLCVVDPYCIVFPGASAKYKQWSVEKFVACLEHIATKYGLIPVLCGSPAEKILCAELASQATVKCVDYSGKTSLEEFVEVVRGATLLISNDTSAVHIAAGVSTPSVCILGGGHYGRFMPYPEAIDGVRPLVAMVQMDCFNCNWSCVHSNNYAEPYPCIVSVTVEQVIVLVEKIMSGTKSSQNIDNLSIHRLY